MADYYVDGDNGNDAWTGATDGHGAPDGAKATIMAAVALAGIGDTVHVQSNGATTYTELVNLAGIRCHLVGYYTTPGEDEPTALPIIDGGGVRVQCVLINHITSYYTIQIVRNFELLDATTHGLEANTVSGSLVLILDNIYTHDNGQCGIYTSCFRTQFTRIAAIDNLYEGVYIYGGNGLGANVLSFNNGLIGIQGNATYGLLVLVHSVTSCNALGNAHDIDLAANVTSDDPDTLDCIETSTNGGVLVATGMSNAPAFGVDPLTASVLVLLDCGFFQNVGGNVDGTAMVSVGGVAGNDPLYASAGAPNYNYTLGGGSPWKQQLLELGVNVDPDDSYPDIGGMQLQVTGGAGGVGCGRGFLRGTA